MKLRNTLLVTCVASITMAWGCGGDSTKPADTSILEDINTTETVTPDVADDIATVDTAPEVIQPDVIGTDVPTTEVADDVATEETAVEDVAVEETAVEDTTVEDIAAEVVIPTSPILKRGDRCDDLSTLGVDTLPLVDTVADTSIFTDRYIYTLGLACGGEQFGDNWGDSSPDVVYTLTPALDGFYTITATPTANFDLGLMVTKGCPPRNAGDLDAMVCLGAADSGIPGDGIAEMVQTHLQAGVTYFIVVDGYDNVNSATGGFTLDISLGEDCGDRIDNDDNGATDCADAQCSGAPACNEANTALYGANACANETDDDGDGFTDCGDDDCALVPACIETLCDDSIDNNGNGFTDCADDDCALVPACIETLCDDLVDNNGNGFTDCADDDCALAPACIESICDDNLDNNDNGLTDCEDPGCNRSAICGPLGDTCERPNTLVSGVKVNLNTSGLTNTAIPGDDRAPGCSWWLADNTAPDLWYQYTATVTGTVRVLLEEDGWDAVINIIDGTGGCPTGPIPACLVGRDAPDEPVEFAAIAGKTYYVIVDGWDDNTDRGAAELTLTAIAPEICDDLVDNDGDSKTDCADPNCFGVAPCPEAPPGDSCGTAFSLTDGLLDVSFDSCTLNDDYAASSSGLCKTMGTGGDALATFTAEAAGSYLVEFGIPTGGTAFNQVINVVKSNACPASTPLVCSGGADAIFTTGSPEKLRVEALAGETFWVVAGSSGTTCGPATLKITRLPNEICDDLADNDQDGITDCADSDCFGVGTCPTEPLGYSCASPFSLEAGVLNATFNSCSYANTFEGSSSSSCQKMGNGGNSIATFTAEETGSYIVTYGLASGGVYFDRILNVVKSPTCPASAPTSCAYSTDTGSETAAERVRINAQAGETFWIITDGWFNSPTANCGLARLTINKVGPEVCDDGLDNDDNGKADCADTACASSSLCNESATSGGCTDGVTNDNDALIDCADPDCRNDTVACPNGLLGDSCASPLAYPADGATLNLNLSAYSDSFLSVANQGNQVCKAVDATAVTKDFVIAFTPATTGRFSATAATTAVNVVLHRVSLPECTTTSGRKILENCVASANAATATSGTERLDFDGIVGETVYFIVDSANATTGSVAFKVASIAAEICDGGADEDLDGRTDCLDSDCFGVGTCPNGIPGDTCGSALVLDANNTSATFDTCIYTNNYELSGTGGCIKMGSAGDAIATFTAATTDTYVVTLGVANGGTYYDRTLNVVKSTTCPASSPTACAYGTDTGTSTSPETIRVEALAGEQFWIIADSWTTGCGLVTLTLTRLSDEICGDNLDNDQNGQTDCADAACGGLVACNESLTTGGCTDQIDNDSDLLVDCNDPDCRGIDGCPDAAPGEACSTAIPLTLTAQEVVDTCDYEATYPFVSGGGCTRVTYEDVVFSFIAPAAGNYRVKVQSVWLDLVSAVNVIVGGTCPTGSANICQGSAVNSSSSSIATTGSFAMAAGETALIFVGSGYSFQECDMTSVSVEVAP